MNVEQFEKLEKSLYDRGYRKYIQHWKHEDYVIGLPLHKEDNKWDEDRYAYQILLHIYDHRNWPSEFNVPSEERNKVGIEITIDVSRTIDERMELVTSWEDDTKIEDVEYMAEKFYAWVQEVYPEPRKETL